MRSEGLIDEEMWVVAGPFGGHVASFFTRGLAAETGRPPRSLSVHFLKAPQAGPVEVETTVEREGRTISFVSQRMTQEGRTVALGLGSAGEPHQSEHEWLDAEPPQVAPPEDCVPIRQSSRAPRFFGRFDIRFADGGSPVQPIDRAYNVAWMRHEDGRRLDAEALTYLADGWMPAAFSRIGGFLVVPTVDLTIHFRGEGEEWGLVVNRSAQSGGGTWVEDTDVWSPAGELLVVARQMAVIR